MTCKKYSYKVLERYRNQDGKIELDKLQELIHNKISSDAALQKSITENRKLRISNIIYKALLISLNEQMEEAKEGFMIDICHVRKWLLDDDINPSMCFSDIETELKKIRDNALSAGKRKTTKI